MSEIPLTPLERHQDEQRMLFSAELIQNGATITATGRLSLTEAQYYRLCDRERYSSEVHDWLDTDIETAFYHSYLDKMQNQRHVNALLYGGIQRFRDAMAVGSENGLVGDKGRAAIALLLANEFGLEWLGYPTANDVAGYCRSLDEVPGRVVHRRIRAGISAANILARVNEPANKLATALDFSVRGSQRWLDADNQHRVIQRVRCAAAIFAVDFTQAREQL